MEGGNGRNDWLHGIFLGVPSSCAPPLTWHPALHLFVCMYCVWWHLSFGRCCGIRGWRLCLVRFELWNYQVWSDAKRGRGRRETFARMSRILSSRKKMVQYRSPYDTHTESFYRFITPLRINDAASQANRIHAVCSIAETCCRMQLQMPPLTSEADERHLYLECTCLELM
jgi:hypothetical protein